MARREEHSQSLQLISIGNKNAPVTVWQCKPLFSLFISERTASRCARTKTAGENDKGFPAVYCSAIIQELLWGFMLSHEALVRSVSIYTLCHKPCYSMVVSK